MGNVYCAVTGASGYVGSRIAVRLGVDFCIVPLGRTVGSEGIPWALGDAVAEGLRMRRVKVLVHAAWDFEDAKGSVDGSLRLIEEAVAAGVVQIVFISTISAFAGARSQYGRAKLKVEEMVLAAGGTVLRPGLVWGTSPGGMLGTIRKQVSRGGLVPIIGDGKYPQFLVHEEDLAEVVRLAAHGMFQGRVLTVAHPRPWPLRNLILKLATEQGTNARLVGVPWPVVYGGLKTAETLGLKLGFRSDSVLSLVHQNSAPEILEDPPLRDFGQEKLG